MTLMRSLRKLYKSLENYSKVLFTDKHFREFIERSEKVKKVLKKTLKTNINHPQRFQIEALINRVVTLRARINNFVKNNDISVKKGGSAFQNRISTTLFINHKHKDVTKFFHANESNVVRLLKKRIREYKCIKVVPIFVGKFQIRDRIEIKYIYNSTKLITKNMSLHHFYKNEMVPELLTNLENFEANGSDPQLIEIVNLTLNVNKCNPLRAGSFIELPKFIKNRKAVVNIKNRDNYCFLWCLFKHFYPDHPLSKNLNKSISRKNELRAFNLFEKCFGNLKNYSFPFPLKSIPAFEKDKDISINVFVIDNDKIFPFHITREKKELHVNLLLLEKDGKYHYCLIQNLSKLLRSQLSNHKNKIFICEQCLNYFYKERKLEKHVKICMDVNKCAINLPSEDDKILKFKNYKHQLFNSFVIYYDVECILKECDDGKAYQEHEIFCIGLYVVNRWDEEKSFYKKFYGDNVAERFMLELEEIAHMVEKVIFISKK